MNGDDDLKRKDDHLGPSAALCKVETDIEVSVDPEGNVFVDLEPDSGAPGNCVSLTYFQARLLSDALLETAFKAEGKWADTHPTGAKK